MSTEVTPKITLSWRKFLQSDEGVKGMLYLREHVPTISVGDSHNIIFAAGKSEGYKNAIDTISEILAMAKPKEEEIENR